MGLEKTGIKYQIFEREKNQLFSILQKPNKPFLGLRLVLQPERSVCLHKVLLIGRWIVYRDGDAGRESRRGVI